MVAVNMIGGVTMAFITVVDTLSTGVSNDYLYAAI